MGDYVAPADAGASEDGSRLGNGQHPVPISVGRTVADGVRLRGGIRVELAYSVYDPRRD